MRALSTYLDTSETADGVSLFETIEIESVGRNLPRQVRNIYKRRQTVVDSVRLWLEISTCLAISATADGVSPADSTFNFIAAIAYLQLQVCNSM